MKLGLHTFAFAQAWDAATFKAQADQLTALDVRVLEIPLLNPGTIDCDLIRQFAQEHGFEVVASLGLPAVCDVVSAPEQAAAFVELALQDCQRMGSQALSGVTYGTIGKTTGMPPTQIEKDATARHLDRIAKSAAVLGLRLGIEPCNRYETHIMNTASHAVTFIERVGADNLFIHLDTYHMNIEETGYADGFLAAGQHLGYVHLSEANRGTPGQGTIDWGAVFGGLRQVGFNGTATLESMNYTAPEIASGLAIWRPVADDKDDVVGKGIPFLTSQASLAGHPFGED